MSLAVRYFGQKRLLLRVACDGPLARTRKKLKNGTAAIKTCCGDSVLSARHKALTLRACWMTLLSQRTTFFHSRSSFLHKSFTPHTHAEGFSRSQNTVNSVSLLYFSTQPKAHKQINSKPQRVVNNATESNTQCDTVARTWDLPKPVLPEQTWVDVNKVSNSDKEHLPRDAKDEQITRSAAAAAAAVTSDREVVEETVGVDKTEIAKDVKKPGIFKRFHQTYKEYGKVLVGVHIFTSSMWTGLFYLAAVSGVNVEPFLRWVGASDTIVHFYTMPGVGNLAVAYLMYKLATPARYTVTIGGTHLAVKLLRRWGYMQPIPESDSLRSLVKDGKTKVKAKYEEIQDKMDDMRDELKEFTSKDKKAN